MGFSMELFLVSPEPWGGEKPANLKIWKPRGIISGYASWPGEGNPMPKGEALASLCMLSWLFSKILEETKTLNRRKLAPIFAIPEDIIEKDPGDTLFTPACEQWVNERADTLPERSNVVFPLWHESERKGFPGRHARIEHNRIVRLSKRTFRNWKEQTDYDPVTGGSFFWATPKNAADWLRELERGEERVSQQELKKDDRAQKFVRAYRKYLSEIHGTGYRIIFTTEGWLRVQSSLLVHY